MQTSLPADSIPDKVTYRATLRRVSDLVDLDPALGTPEGEELDRLGTLVQAYEAVHYRIERDA